MDAQSWLDQISPSFYWLFIFFSAFIENVFPPYPGDTVTVVGGYLVGVDKLSIVVLTSSVFGGSLAGALAMYYFGQKIIFFLGYTLKIKAIAKKLEKEKIEKIQNWFKKYGFFTIVFSRFSAGIRFFVAIVAGMVKMNIFKFLLAFSFATIFWNALLIWGGYALGDNWSQVSKYLKIYNGVLIMLIGIGILIFFISRSKFIKKLKLR